MKAGHEELERAVASLAAEVEGLAARVAALENGRRRERRPAPPPPSEGVTAGEEPPGLLRWAGTSTVLPRISTLSFLLVVALAFRTITDSGIIGAVPGAWLGMGYAAALLAAGAVLYRRRRPVAPIYTLCGTILIFVIVAETTARFGSLGGPAAHLIIIATATATAAISRAFRTVVPVLAGTFGMTLAGVAINLPDPSFPALSIILLAGNVLALWGAEQQRRNWLRWILLVLTVVLLQVWGMKIGVHLKHPDIQAPPLEEAWFFPLLLLFAVFYFASSLRMIARYEGARIPVLDYSLPVINVITAFSAAAYVAVPRWGGSTAVGVGGIGGTLAYVAAAAWLTKRREAGSPGAGACVFAAALLLALSVPAVLGSLLLSIPAVTLAGYIFAVLSARWESGGIRVVSYLLQLYSAAAVAAVCIALGPGRQPVALAVAGGSLSVVGFLHYRWCRRTAPAARSLLFKELDRRDCCAVTLLFSSLAGGFFFFLTGVWQVVGHLPGDPRNTFIGSQSLLINIAAAVLLSVALVRRNTEVRAMAIILILIGAAKVFIYDMVGTHGIPRLVSVFSFGLVAAIASLVMSRWTRGGGADSSGE